MYLSEKIKRKNNEFILRKLSSAPSPDWYNWIKLPDVWVSLMGSVSKVWRNNSQFIFNSLAVSLPTLLGPPERRQGIPGGSRLRDELKLWGEFGGGDLHVGSSVAPDRKIILATNFIIERREREEWNRTKSIALLWKTLMSNSKNFSFPFRLLF